MSVAKILLHHAKAALRDNGTLTESDVRAIMREAWDGQTQSVHDQAPKPLLLIRWHYWASADSGARALLDKYAEAAFADDPTLVLWAAEVFAPGGRLAPPAGAPPAPRVENDNRLFGSWSHQQYLVGGGTTHTTYRYRVFGPDGRFADTARSSVLTTFFDAAGNWAGWNSAMTDASPSDRGRWGTLGSNLILHWDNGGQTTYQYEVAGASLLLIPARGENQLWRRR